MRRAAWAALAVVWLAVAVGCSDDTSASPRDELILATTTSTQDSGLLDELVPQFEEDSDCTVKTVAVGSGEALAMGENGNADALLVHSPSDEKAFMAAGHGVSRNPVMYNDFVLVGPADDPAGVAESADAADALAAIAQAQEPFASRADDSGTEAKELSLWEEAGIEPSGSWYIGTGQGMGDTLTIASQKQAYTLSDRGTYLATEGLDLDIVFEGSADLRNNYSVIVVDDEGVNTACAEEFGQWIRSDSTQRLIGEFGVETYGEALFTPDAD
ncbi:MAG: tungsten ABC transporter substrate-binding protein [Propionibacteriales bacterium]|nr:tungsten ABC transporter substrate-binding protein [Propionibacteriales bacterium]